jgi:hypothetical protein
MAAVLSELFNPLGELQYDANQDTYNTSAESKVAQWFGRISHSIAIEFTYADMLTLRTGAMLQSEKYAHTNSINAGFTFKYSFLNLSFAYAFPISKYNFFAQAFYFSTAFSFK